MGELYTFIYHTHKNKSWLSKSTLKAATIWEENQFKTETFTEPTSKIM